MKLLAKSSSALFSSVVLSTVHSGSVSMLT